MLLFVDYYRSADDSSCNRYIIEAKCLPVFLMNEREYIVLKIIGQSFMLHQIRKMIGLVIGIIKGYISEDIFGCIFNKERVSFR